MLYIYIYMYTYRSEKLGHELSLATAPGLGAALLTAGCTAVLAAGASPSRRFVNVAAALKVALVLRGSHLSNTEVANHAANSIGRIRQATP